MKKVAIGCGIAALILAALSIGATIFGLRWMKGQVHDAERYTRLTHEMETAYGAPADYVPPADGNYDPERVALFAHLRTILETSGAPLRDEANALAAGGEKGRFTKLRTMMRLLNTGADYLATADSLLLAAGMSHGEYAHLQTLWLHGARAAHASLDSLDSLDRLDTWPSSFAANEADPDGEKKFLKAFDSMARDYRDAARTLLQQHARHAREAAEELGANCPTCPAWIDYLDDQLDTARTRRAGVPMLDPIPASLELAFEPHDFALAATRPHDYGSWLTAILMVTELDDDGGNGINFKFGD